MPRLQREARRRMCGYRLWIDSRKHCNNARQCAMPHTTGHASTYASNTIHGNGQDAARGRERRTNLRHALAQVRQGARSLKRRILNGKTGRVRRESGSGISVCLWQTGHRGKTSTLSASERQEESPDPFESVQTGDDVVEFYARYGQDSPVKFFYCNRYARVLFAPRIQRH